MSGLSLAEIRSRLYALSSDRKADLAEGALLIAAEDAPDLDVDRYLGFVDEFAARVSSRVGQDRAQETWRDALGEELFVREGFGGDTDDYYDPRNSYLNSVIDRRRGIPITLSIVYLATATRLGLPVAGVNAPGHFLVRAGDTIVDPFLGGKTVSRDALVDQLRQLNAPDPETDVNQLLDDPPSPRAIFCRVLNNLKANHLRRNDFTHALSAVDRLVRLNPGNPGELRDRGVLYQKLECPRAAVADFERYLELVPNDPEADVIRNAMVELVSSAERLH
jgi:regulator of sirC expression with transglutaminase-like and TPR domain